jgi:hypothetical protein
MLQFLLVEGREPVQKAFSPLASWRNGKPLFQLPRQRQLFVQRWRLLFGAGRRCCLAWLNESACLKPRLDRLLGLLYLLLELVEPAAQRQKHGQF